MVKRNRKHNKSGTLLWVRSAAFKRFSQAIVKGLGILITLPAQFALAQDSVTQQLPATAASTLPCPDLAPYYPGADTDWQLLQQQLFPLMPQCLQSTEYFSLLGAALMNTDRLPDALEALERALLLDPANGGAQIDYAEALYRQGQLFSALELNQQILARSDVPAHLNPMLQQRQDAWRGLTRQLNINGDLLAGYDSNLNGAPSPDQITLTLSGESVVLPLSEQYQPIEGAYANLRLGARYRQLAPQHQHNVTVELRGRLSKDQDSDLLQLDTRYAFIKPEQNRSWQFNTGMSHLFFGGSPLYTATEAGGRYVYRSSFDIASRGNCKPFSSAAAQHQLFHNQSRLNAIETKLSVGLNCQLVFNNDRQQFVPEFGLLNNDPVKDGRPGASRHGWQLNLDWQLAMLKGTVSAQLNHTEMQDSDGYNPLLADDAERWLKRSYVLLQYRQALDERTTLLINTYHQHQRSNLELFRSRDSSIEIGISHQF
ncbi:tetratricopeptide repeat protein [Gammaproteobacteria bacterium LSUCC0112]|nr:tetratricopeptide repeat protein [Gammaproteobacteria bacterium LSUCC0112]